MESENPWWPRGRDSVTSNRIWESTASTSLSCRLANLANPVFMSALASFVWLSSISAVCLYIYKSACLPVDRYALPASGKLCPVCLWTNMSCLLSCMPLQYADTVTCCICNPVFIILYLLFPLLSISKVGTQIFVLVRKSQIRKFLGSFRNCKSANFWGVPARKSANLFGVQVRKSQIRKFARPKAVFDPDSHWFASQVLSLPT